MHLQTETLASSLASPAHVSHHKAEAKSADALDLSAALHAASADAMANGSSLQYAKHASSVCAPKGWAWPVGACVSKTNLWVVGQKATRC